MSTEDFDKASNHPYECKCELCKQWWAEVPAEEEEDASICELDEEGIPY